MTGRGPPTLQIGLRFEAIALVCGHPEALRHPGH